MSRLAALGGSHLPQMNRAGDLCPVSMARAMFSAGMGPAGVWPPKAKGALLQAPHAGARTEQTGRTSPLAGLEQEFLPHGGSNLDSGRSEAELLPD